MLEIIGLVKWVSSSHDAVVMSNLVCLTCLWLFWLLGAKLISTCCLPVTKGRNWLTHHWSVILFCYEQAGCTYQVFAPSRWMLTVAWSEINKNVKKEGNVLYQIMLFYCHPCRGVIFFPHYYYFFLVWQTIFCVCYLCYLSCVNSDLSHTPPHPTYIHVCPKTRMDV